MELSYNKNVSLKIFNNINDLAIETLQFLNSGNIAISGGSTYLKLLKLWSEKQLKLDKVNFYPVDERVIDFSSEFSNWGNSYRNFLSKYDKNRDHHFTDSEEYNQVLQDVKMDTIFLGVGDDGHTASLFEIEDIFKYPDLKAISTTSPKEPKNRITLTGDYIISATNIIIIFYGDGKQEIVNKVLENMDLPITKLLSKVKNGTIYIHNRLIKE